MDRQVLDVTCAGRMIWFNKHDQRAIYVDRREGEFTLCDGRTYTIAPDLTADFRQLPFPNNKFRLVVFDPPHLAKCGQNSWLAKKYGRLAPAWQDDICAGFSEAFRVLKPGGVLVFKWSEAGRKGGRPRKQNESNLLLDVKANGKQNEKQKEMNNDLGED